MKDWKGNSKSTFVTLGASNHTEKEREVNDYYSTDPRAGEMLLDLIPELDNIYECAVGQGHLAKVFCRDVDFEEFNEKTKKAIKDTEKKIGKSPTYNSASDMFASMGITTH